MTDPVADAARSAAAILALDLNPDLPTEVEAALAARARVQRPNRFLDPVSLGSLIVSVATLAWTIYNDQHNRSQERKHEPDRAAKELETDPFAHQVQDALRDQGMNMPPGTERITEIVAIEIIRQSGPQK